MTRAIRNLPDLLGSRICHDLISPIGAISNGVELISMSGDLSGPEMTLIAESVDSANARIRFFRIAFGVASPEQRIGRNEITGILRDMSRGGRMVIDWQPDQDLPRPQVKLAFLVLQCFESAMPRGGRVSVSVVGDSWALLGECDQIRFDQDLWHMLIDPDTEGPLDAGHVHFPLAGHCARDTGRQLQVESSASSARVRF